MGSCTSESAETCNREIRVGVSACLLGRPVRYDGGHKYNADVTDILGRVFSLVAVCPEFEAGMPVPRERLHLVRSGGRVRMIAAGSGRDWSQITQRFARQRIRELKRLAVSAFILKRGSPSCGIRDVPVFTVHGQTSACGRGLFTESLLRSMPSLPVEDEAGLADPLTREDFIARVRAYHRMQFSNQPSHR